MLEEVLRGACALEPGMPVLAGISGGPDSLCLLEVLRLAGYPVIVAHFDHRLRPESAAECQAVAELAQRMSLPFVTDSADVCAWAAEQGLSIEEAARSLRYRFLFAAARRLEAQAVAVGHTADDQVETVLMHFLRGAGLSGLKGMACRSLLPTFDPGIPLVRPLLSLWRGDTEDYCRQHDLVPHIDPSNTDETYFRNRLRHTLIPELEKYNPRFKQALVRTALALQGDHALLQSSLEAAWEQAVAALGDGWVAFKLGWLRDSAPGIQRGLLRRAAESLQPANRDIGFDALERATAFLHAGPGRQTDFINGLVLFFEGDRVYLASSHADLPCSFWPQAAQQTFLADQPILLGDGWVLAAETLPLQAAEWQANPDPWVAWLDADRLPEGLTVRPRQAGDIFLPLGMHGQTVKVREFLINNKIPRRARAHWPLVCTGDLVAWVPGCRIAHPLRITPQTSRVVKLSLKKK